MPRSIAFADGQLDIVGATHVEITVSKTGDRVWVNIDGRCRLRICQIEETVTLDSQLIRVQPHRK